MLATAAWSMEACMRCKRPPVAPPPQPDPHGPCSLPDCVLALGVCILGLGLCNLSLGLGSLGRKLGFGHVAAQCLDRLPAAKADRQEDAPRPGRRELRLATAAGEPAGCAHAFGCLGWCVLYCTAKRCNVQYGSIWQVPSACKAVRPDCLLGGCVTALALHHHGHHCSSRSSPASPPTQERCAKPRALWRAHHALGGAGLHGTHMLAARQLLAGQPHTPGSGQLCGGRVARRGLLLELVDGGARLVARVGGLALLRAAVA